MTTAQRETTPARIETRADQPALRRRGIQIDLGRVIERPDTVARLIDTYASLGYNAIQFYFEDALVFPSHPKLARPWAWTIEQAMTLSDRARNLGMAVIPAIQSLGHCAWVGAHPDYRELDEGFDLHQHLGVLCPSRPRTLDMLEGMIRDVAPLASDPQGTGIIHLGLDESFSIGLCNLCKPRCANIGEGGIFVEHAKAVAAMARRVGRRPAIWGDMFYYYPDAAAQLDRDIVIFDWYYYAFDRTPGIEMFNFAPVDTLALWRKLGHEVWGCPSSAFTTIMPINLPSECVANARSWLGYLRRHDYDAMMVTQWELKSTTIDLSTLTEAAIAILLTEGDVPQNSTPSLLQRAAEFLFHRPHLGTLIEQLGQLRLHGHCARRWLHAPTLEAMITCQGTARDHADRAAARRVNELAHAIGDQLRGTPRAEHGRVFVLAAQWLAYQYEKRFTLNAAAEHVAQGRFSDAGAVLAPLAITARALSEAWQNEWDRNRFSEDLSSTPARLHEEAQMFERELAALRAALAGNTYNGALDCAVVVVHVRNSHPATPCLAVAVSSDAQTFTPSGKAWVLEFSSHAARPVSDDELLYAFPIRGVDDARHVRVTAVGVGGFTLRGIELCHGGLRRQPIAAHATGLCSDPAPLLSGEPGSATIVMGLTNPRDRFNQLLAQGQTSQLFSMEHGAVTVRFS